MLPEPNSPWPPKELQRVHEDIAKWSAWWSGSAEELSRVYGGDYGDNQESFFKRGLIPSLSRFFWGERSAPGEKRTKLHVPLAAEIAQVSADLLFGQPPTLIVKDDETTQTRVDELFGERTGQILHEAAETCAALGHVYLRVGWDLEVDSTGPLLSVIDADAAFPVYRYGRLQEVTFVREWDDAGTVLRHFELHEPGYVWHAVYLGDHQNLGRQVSLADHPQTADLVDDEMIPDEARNGSGVATGIDRLDVVGIKNARTRTWRHIPAARDLGRADISGIEQDLDALDDIFSSWMRDIRHGRARLHVPAHMLESNGLGQPATFNLDRELYVGLNTPPDGQLQLEETQFKIRHEEHRESARTVIERCVSGAGYSHQTFGLETSHAAQTATDSWAKQVRSQHTRNGKIRHWLPGVDDTRWLLLAVDRVHFKGKGNPDAKCATKFADTVSESQIVRAQTALTLLQGEAASTRTRVELVHNDWDGDQIAEEVRLIEGEADARQEEMADQQAPMGDPDEPDDNMQEDPKRQA